MEKFIRNKKEQIDKKYEIKNEKKEKKSGRYVWFYWYLMSGCSS